MNGKLLVLGSGDILDEAATIARSLYADGEVEVVEIFAADRFNFELPDLSAYPPAEWRAFVALDDRGLNMSRHQLVAQIKAKGYKLERLVATDALVSPSAVLGENAMVSKGAIVQRNCKIGLNVVVRPWARVGEDSKLGNGVFVDIRAAVGRGAELGDYVTVGAGAEVAADTKVGRYCELRKPMTYKGQIPDRTFYFDRFENPVSVIAPL